MTIKAKQLKLEAAYRYFIYIVLFFLVLIQMSTAYSRYIHLQTTYPDFSLKYFRLFIFLCGLLVMIVGIVVFFIIKDRSLRDKELYLTFENGVLTIPSAVSNKTKTVAIDNIDRILFEGLNKDVIRIEEKVSSYWMSPRIYNVFEMDTKEIYKMLMKELIEIPEE